MRLRRTKDLFDYTIAAIDTDIGRVHDFYFDDQKWTIRYIVVETGEILAGRKVLISPTALQDRAWSPLHIWAKLTWQQVESSPSVDLHKPISRQREIEQHDHYGWPYYWPGAGLWGSRTHPAALAKDARKKKNAPQKNSSADAHLRSTREVAGYHVSAIGGEVGHVEDFLFDDKTWEIRYAIVDTKNWWGGKRVLIHPQWIKRVSWKNRMIYVNLSRELVGKSPAWDARQPLSRSYEIQLHKHYGSAPYWTSVK
ncbi:MAG TPA: PRC-barrel domain-containing protein [Verrucomicrobiae bacterium]|nr:PRC-barrel domain-containing protein [Verrucomicrobiae bacterium]